MAEETLETRTKTFEPTVLAEQPIEDPRKTVFLIEDEEPLRNYLDNTLTEWGYRVLSASSLNEAIEILRNEKRIDYASLDRTFLGANNTKIPFDKNSFSYGNALAKAIRRRHPNVKIVGLSQEHEQFNGDFDLKLSKADESFIDDYKAFFQDRTGEA